MRRVECKSTGESFSVRPSFVLPYQTGNTDDVRGVLNVDLGAGRHRVFMSDEASSHIDTVQITRNKHGEIPSTAGLATFTGNMIYVAGLAPADAELYRPNSSSMLDTGEK